MGLRGSDTVALSLQDLKVPVEQRLAAEGDGFKIALEALDAGRIGVAAQSLGVATAAFEEAVRYSQQRNAFGQPLARIQAIQFKLAEMERRVQCARLLIHRAAWLKDAGQPFAREASMAKLYASEAASEPAPGSDSENAASSLLTSRGRNRRRWSSLPKRNTGSAPTELCTAIMIASAAETRAISSSTITMVRAS